MSSVKIFSGSVTRLCGGLGLVLTLFFAVAASGDEAAAEKATACVPETPCKDVIYCPLVQPPTLWSSNGVLNTYLTVRMRDACVPVVKFQTTQETATEAISEWRTMRLRNYHSPATPKGATYGPTLRVRKTTLQDPTRPPSSSNPVKFPGDEIKVDLRNRLPSSDTSADACRPAAYFVCSDNPTQQCTCTDRQGSCSEASQFNCDGDPGRSCRKVTIDQEEPNCIHGTEVTNLHYHGTHVSPQPPQDYVLVSVYSSHQDPKPDLDFENDPSLAWGNYRTHINPLPWNQAPGTHWYHPHKHGSTSVQLINGMAGALLIQGAFDDYLYELYGVSISDPNQRFEKVLIVQQLWDDVLFFRANKPSGYEPYPTINGQLIPTIHMRYGEVQRWRLIGATTNARVQVLASFSLPESEFRGFEVRQIAQDGVQFAPDNYERQPLGNAEDGFEISPGNRVDLLVRAPDIPPGGGSTTFFVQQRVVGDLPEEVREIVRAQNAYMKKLAGIVDSKAEEFSGPLIRVEVSGVVTPPMGLPTRWPQTPYFLRDLEDEGKNREMTFSMTTTSTGGSTQGTPGNKFFIDGYQFSGACAGVTVGLGDTETWKIYNTSNPQHPFHIHINPFQILSRVWTTSDGKTQSTIFDPPYPWMDTIGLKSGTITAPSVTTIRQKYEDYSGGYVLHCHFLGHEDRGMMTGVQAVCPTDDTSKGPIHFGRTVRNGRADSCSERAREVSPLPDCPGILESEGGTAGAHRH